MSWERERALRFALVEAGERLWRQGLVAHTDGNLSVRLDDEWFLITPSGVNKGKMRPYQLLRIALADGRVDGHGKPSVETPMHLAIYRRHRHIGAVVHAHPPYATAFAAAGLSLTEPVFPEMVVRFGEVPLVPYATPGTDELAEAVAAALQGRSAVLLQNHGALTVAATVEEACGLMEALEWTAKVIWLAKGLGGAKPLTSDEVRRLRRDMP
jgi:L-fuculose-phosphate aldolase